MLTCDFIKYYCIHARLFWLIFIIEYLYLCRKEIACNSLYKENTNKLTVLYARRSCGVAVNIRAEDCGYRAEGRWRSWQLRVTGSRNTSVNAWRVLYLWMMLWRMRVFGVEGMCVFVYRVEFNRGVFAQHLNSLL